MPVSAEQRDIIMQDPLVQQAMELFEGAVINLERELPVTTADASEETE